MILYQLRCKDDHTFEAWFRDGAAYDVQAKDGHVECPYCGTTTISKAPMAPRILSGRGQDADAENAPQEALLEHDINAMSPQRAQEVAQQILDAVGKIRTYAEQNFEDVGKEFAEEALKIHHGESEERGIYGHATEDEARELEDEGVDFVRLPGAPRRDG
jgi:hypothetical protein